MLGSGEYYDHTRSLKEVISLVNAHQLGEVFIDGRLIRFIQTNLKGNDGRMHSTVRVFEYVNAHRSDADLKHIDDYEARSKFAAKALLAALADSTDKTLIAELVTLRMNLEEA